MNTVPMAGRRFRPRGCRFGCCVPDRRADPARRTRRRERAETRRLAAAATAPGRDTGSEYRPE